MSTWPLFPLICSLLGATARADLTPAFLQQVKDRSAVECVYHNHRLSPKPSFETILPRTLLQELVRIDLDKEAVLRSVYGIVITPSMVDAEVNRINNSTRAPKILTELKAALGNDAARFARTVARPIVVERLLREHFDADAGHHAAQRRQAEQTRQALLAARQAGAGFDQLLEHLKGGHSNALSDITWRLGPRPNAHPIPNPLDDAEVHRRFGPQAQLLSVPSRGTEEPARYFEDLPLDLQRVLRVQLRQSGDVSAVIEMPRGFLVYLAKERTGSSRRVVCLTIPKQSYESWLTPLRKEMQQP